MYRHIQHDYPLTLIGNMDETPMIFDLLDNITINETEMQSVSIRIIGHEKTNFTIVLTYMANGIKLPPLVIFKLKKSSTR